MNIAGCDMLFIVVDISLWPFLCDGACLKRKGCDFLGDFGRSMRPAGWHFHKPAGSNQMGDPIDLLG